MKPFPTPGAPRRTQHLDLSGIARTVGGHKIDQQREALSYAVYTDGSPAGIWGRVWRHGAYRECKWTDEGVSMYAARTSEYDLQMPASAALPAAPATPATEGAQKL